MDNEHQWRAIAASALDWDQAHAPFGRAVAEMPPALRGVRPNGSPHSAWELVEHIRITQRDLLDFCIGTDYHEPVWPDDYWPRSPAPPSDDAWEASVRRVHADREAFQRWVMEAPVDFTSRIPHGTGQTYLRTVLVAVDHTSYHVGQIVLVRRLLGAWAG